MSFYRRGQVSVKWNTWRGSLSGSCCNITRQLFLWCLECKYFLCRSQRTAARDPVRLMHVTGPLFTHMTNVFQHLCVCRVFWHGVSPNSTNYKWKLCTAQSFTGHIWCHVCFFTQSQKLFFTHHQVITLLEWRVPAAANHITCGWGWKETPLNINGFIHVISFGRITFTQKIGSFNWKWFKRFIKVQYVTLG